MQTTPDLNRKSESRKQKVGGLCQSTAMIDGDESPHPPPTTKLSRGVPAAVDGESYPSYSDGSNGSIVDADLIEEINQDFHVEEVIMKQDTHDLFCPNCKSCITRKVICVRRKKPKLLVPIAGRNKTKPIRKPKPQLDVRAADGDESDGDESDEAKAYRPWSIFRPFTKKKTGKPLVMNIHDFTNCVPNSISELRERQKDEGIAPTSPTISEAPRKNTEVSPDDGLAGKKNGGDVILQVVPDPEPESTTGVETREGQGWDILKSIVYGGLVEAITSLGVVSSAAGAGATTLSILALGLVNLIAGLLIFCHNLRELKIERYEESPYQLNEQEGRYEKLLGRRENFPLHASLAVISFLFFGLLPPVIYGFSFRESGNKDLKLEAVLGASLICILLLAIAKCHVNRAFLISYIKTILYYMSTGVVVSCVSYLVGELVKNFVEKLGWFDSTATLSISSIVTSKSMDLHWASY